MIDTAQFLGNIVISVLLAYLVGFIINGIFSLFVSIR